MDTNGSGESGFEQRCWRLLDGLSPGIFGPLKSDEAPEMAMEGVNSLFNVGWKPPVSMVQNVEYRDSQDQIDSSSYAAATLKNQEINHASHIVQYPSDSCLQELLPNLSCLGDGSFSQMVSHLRQCNPYPIALSPDCTVEVNGSKKSKPSENVAFNCGQILEEHHIAGDGSTGTEPRLNGNKRKRMPDGHSRLTQSKNVETRQQDDECPEEDDKGKRKIEQSTVANVHGKLVGKEVEICSAYAEAPKEDYIHVRAKRGQATNSHSLAERIRREKISERMKFLQDLVPGCSKITGKAVMLDEIINYVQSLQHQVHNSRDSRAAMPAFDAGTSSSRSIPQVTLQGSSPINQNSNLRIRSPSYLPMPSLWEDELQSASQMGFTSS